MFPSCFPGYFRKRRFALIAGIFICAGAFSGCAFTESSTAYTIGPNGAVTRVEQTARKFPYGYSLAVDGSVKPDQHLVDVAGHLIELGGAGIMTHLIDKSAEAQKSQQ